MPKICVKHLLGRFFRRNSPSSVPVHYLLLFLVLSKLEFGVHFEFDYHCVCANSVCICRCVSHVYWCRSKNSLQMNAWEWMNENGNSIALSVCRYCSNIFVLPAQCSSTTEQRSISRTAASVDIFIHLQTTIQTFFRNYSQFRLWRASPYPDLEREYIDESKRAKQMQKQNKQNMVHTYIDKTRNKSDRDSLLAHRESSRAYPCEVWKNTILIHSISINSNWKENTHT